MLKRMIINADDFGLCDGVNRGVALPFRYDRIGHTKHNRVVKASVAVVLFQVRTAAGHQIGGAIAFYSGVPGDNEYGSFTLASPAITNTG